MVRDRVFRSREDRSVAFRHSTYTQRNLQSNSIVERFNGMLKRMIRNAGMLQDDAPWRLYR